MFHERQSSSSTLNETHKITIPIKPRDRTGSLILRSQFAPSAWHAKFGNGTIADAVIDRIARKPRTIHIEGEESMRKRMGGIRWPRCEEKGPPLLPHHWRTVAWP